MARRVTKHYQLSTVYPNISITEDDVEMFLALYRHSIVDANTFRRLLQHRSPERVGKRLRSLMDAEYVVRLRHLERIRRPGGGSFSKAYFLGNKAARLLKEQFGLPIRLNRWKPEGDKLSAIHILHTLECTRFMVDLQVSVGERENIEFEFHDEIYKRKKPLLLEKTPLPSTFKTRVDWQGWRDAEGTQWDGFCALKYLDSNPEKQYRYLFIEIDRGTETIEPKSAKNLRGRAFFKGNSFLKKLVIYGQGFSNTDHKKQFGIPTFQVLTVTTTPGHALTMREAYQKHLAISPHNVSPIRFLFTDFETIKNFDHDILAIPFHDGAGKQRFLA